MAQLKDICQYLDEYLQLDQFQDISQNGLQVEGNPEVTHVAVAVDARLQTFEEAAKRGAQLLLCHHGLYWGRVELLVGHVYKRMQTLIQNQIALYAAHLPLDAHLEVGNNAVMARALGLENLEPWAKFRKQVIGIRGTLPTPIAIDAFTQQVQKLLDPVDGHVQRFGTGSHTIQSVGIVTGDAANEIPRAARDGIDVLITGEPSHIFVPLADELGAYLITGGHYATETFGVKALAEHLATQFDIETSFIHVPTHA